MKICSAPLAAGIVFPCFAAAAVQTGAPQGIEELLEFLDRDGNGQIEAYEGAEAFLLLAQQADTDEDAAVDLGEVRAFLVDLHEQERAERVEAFSEFDVNHDERLTVEETPEELRGMLARTDADGDTIITLEELLSAKDLNAPTAMFEQELLTFLREVDHDGDDAFALSDLPAVQREEFEQEFHQLDIDANGLVSRVELLALVEQELRGALFEVNGSTASMTGVIGPSTPGRVLELIVVHPEVDTIVMQDVPGSMDDESNLRAARLVRRAGLATRVPANGEVASGGTDFFLAGLSRSAPSGARFGVHSWAGFDEEGADLLPDHPEHAKYREFYSEMEIPAAFYEFTLEAAPADGIHWMTAEEIESYGLLNESDPQGNRREDSDERDAEKDDLFCGCILRDAAGKVPADLYRVSEVVESDEYLPLTRTLTACGIVLAAGDDVPDSFLRLVGKTIAEVFRVEEGVDETLQKEVLTRLYEYRAMLPVPRSERSFERLFHQDPGAMDRLQRENSICDIIMAGVPEGQVMEVVEHVLHAVTDVGLHYQFPAEWGISRESKLWEAMRKAIDLGYYDIRSYQDIDEQADPEIYDRVLLQEFAYWFITTAWNLQQTYGPQEEEWTISGRNELREKLPEFFAVYERTVERIMHPPSPSTLAEIGPTRRAERER